MIETWRSKTRVSAIASKSNDNDVFSILPSGRKAIVAAMQYFELGRPSRLAVPEYSSHCVLSNVATLATPIPIQEVLDNGLKPECILLYEQWGWPLVETSVQSVIERGCKVILDCVDSPDGFERHSSSLDSPEVVTIVSLGKCLGLNGGGLISISVDETKNITSDAAKSDQTLMEFGADFYKTHGQTLAPIQPWLDENPIATALQEEARDRKENLQIIAGSSLAGDWSPWMQETTSNGCSAGIAPLFRGQPKEKLYKASEFIRQNFQIAAPVYNFNWSGDPLNSDYAPCLAFPCHGELDMADWIADLEKLHLSL